MPNTEEEEGPFHQSIFEDSNNSRDMEPGQDTINVLYLHHSDHPNYVLSTQLLNDRNYYHWKHSVEISLRVKNKLGFVDGNCLKPDPCSPTLA